MLVTQRIDIIFESINCAKIFNMKGFKTNQLIASLKKITETNSEFVRKKCLHLRENQLKWRPAKYSWSIQEVLAHLNANATYYQPSFAEKIENTKFTTPRDVFVSSPLGKSAWKSMKLGRANNVKRKFNSPRNINPTVYPELIKGDGAPRFIENQEALLTILSNAEKVDLKRTKVPISISKIARLRLGDALMFFVFHNERHIQQIKNLLAHRNFPKK